MKLFAYMVAFDEVDRYLRECLDELLPCLDGLVIYDDQSTDSIREVVADQATLVTRENEEFSFVEDESQFRQTAWNLVEQTFSPTEDDWVISLDADEIIRYPYPEYVREMCQFVQRLGHNALLFHIHEIWTDVQTAPDIRTDGFWAATEGIRACRWQPDGKFKERRMGGGSVPDYADTPFRTKEIDLLHYGYARESDRQAKYRRYSARTGHNPRHISSILKPPTLAPLPPLGIDF